MTSEIDQSDFDLLVIGDINPDLIVSGSDLRVEFGQRETLADHAEILLGGSSAITACAAARLGLRVCFAGLVGDDPAGRFCVRQLRSHGVDTEGVVVDQSTPTGLTVIMQREDDRAIVTVPGSIAALDAGDVDRELVRRARHIHVGSYFLLDGLRDALPELFDEARRNGATTSLDTNDDPARLWAVGDMLDHCDVLLPNEGEALAFAGASTVREASRLLAQRVGVVAITAGRGGALACRGDTVVEVAAAAFDAHLVADAVGAGDNFDAGFLYGYLHDWDLASCLRAGIGAAALSLRGRGGTATSGTIADALAIVGVPA